MTFSNANAEPRNSVKKMANKNFMAGFIQKWLTHHTDQIVRYSFQNSVES